MYPALFNTGEVIDHAKNKSLSWPQSRWWTLYNDPQLNRLVEGAIHDNPSIKIARVREQLAALQSKEVHSSLLPSLETSSLFMQERFTENQFYRAPYAGNVYWNNQITNDLNYQLDLWGQNRSAFATSLDVAQMAAAEQKEVTLTLQTAVVRTYLRLSLFYFLHDIGQQTLQQRTDIFHVTQ